VVRVSSACFFARKAAASISWEREEY